MCGGSLEILPCSRVGHVFRKATPYSFPGGTSQIVNHNNARLVDVWLDEWSEFYYSFNPGSKRNIYINSNLHTRNTTTKCAILTTVMLCIILFMFII